MGQIRLLSDETASQVAAGEVVERPASIVKELAENSLDAGAGEISIDYASGGLRFISVEDDGCGMDREDALLSLERHATSKIRSAEDLVLVSSMGFRGEAIPSIASVSRFRMLTRVANEESGTEILVEGGRVKTVKEAGCAPGTRIEARDLFFNVPARKKFVRGEETESAHILGVLHGLAISAPQVALRCRKDAREILLLPSAGSLEVRLRDLFGRDFLDRLIPLPPFSSEGISLSGFVAKPGEGRRDRLQQFVILNGRPVHCPEVTAPLKEAYAGLMSAGTHPLAVLQIRVSPSSVDCNVHPAKRHVRFSRPDTIRRTVFDAVRGALESVRPQATAQVRSWEPSDPFRPREPELSHGVSKGEPTPQDKPLCHGSPATEVAGTPHVPAPFPEASPVPSSQPGPDQTTATPFRVIGKIGAHFLVLESSEGLVLFDSRSARERIEFERLLRQMEQGEAPCQRLLIPEVIELPAREHAWISENLAPLREAGFLIEPFGGTTVKLEGVPALADSEAPGKCLQEISSVLRAAGRLPRGRGLHETLAKAVCRVAPPPLVLPEAALLVAQLLQCELPYAGPFGQPTMIQFSFAELDRKFGRSPSVVRP